MDCQGKASRMHSPRGRDRQQRAAGILSWEGRLKGLETFEMPNIEAAG
jgi:hypothetical protein